MAIVDLDPELIASRLPESALEAAAGLELHKGSLEEYVTSLAEKGADYMRQVVNADSDVRAWVDRLRGLGTAGLYLYDENG